MLVVTNLNLKLTLELTIGTVNECYKTVDRPAWDSAHEGGPVVWDSAEDSVQDSRPMAWDSAQGSECRETQLGLYHMTYLQSQ